jgi:RNA polymerase sigma-70 factor (ECF subfamily)
MSQDNARRREDPVTRVQRLFIEHSPELRGFVAVLVRDFALVDDVLQETFLTVTKKAKTFDPERNFLAWACGIARFKVMEAGRKSSREWQPLSEEVLDVLAASMPVVPDEDRRLKYLEDCIAELAPQARRMVEMCYSHASKPAEIARQINWTPESVYVALSRARAALRDCVQRRLAAEGGAA